MSAFALLRDLRSAGLALRVHGDQVRFRPRELMTPALATRVKAIKPELIRILHHEASLKSDAAPGAFLMLEAKPANERELRRLLRPRPMQTGELTLGEAATYLAGDKSKRPCYACRSMSWVRSVNAPEDYWHCARCSPPPDPTSDRWVWADDNDGLEVTDG